MIGSAFQRELYSQTRNVGINTSHMKSNQLLSILKKDYKVSHRRREKERKREREREREREKKKKTGRQK